jgi:hypothetical protein
LNVTFAIGSPGMIKPAMNSVITLRPRIKQHGQDSVTIRIYLPSVTLAIAVMIALGRRKINPIATATEKVNREE